MKRRTRSELIPLTVLLLALHPLHAQPMVEDQLLNPGMEDGLANWTPGTDDGGKSTATAEAARSGKLGLQVLDEDSESGSDLQSNLIPATAGETWTASCKARIIAGKGIGLYLMFFDANYRSLNKPELENENIAFLTEKQVDWDDLTVSGEAPDGTAYVALRIRAFTAALATAEFDDFSLSKTTP